MIDPNETFNGTFPFAPHFTTKPGFQFKAQFPNAPVVELPQAGHFCQEDVPETLVALIQQFIQQTS